GTRRRSRARAATRTCRPRGRHVGHAQRAVHQVRDPLRVTGRALLAAAVIISLVPSLALGATAPRAKPRPKPKAPTAPSKPAPEKDTTPVTHEVERGETLSAIAKKYKVTVASLVIANRLRGPRAKLTPGQRLKIPHPGTAPTLRVRRGPV